MVRSIVGTMIDVGRSRISHGFKNSKSRSRSEAGFSVPASGLSLLSIKYNIFIKSWKVKSKIFDINLFNKLLIFVKPYNISFYGVLLSQLQFLFFQL